MLSEGKPPICPDVLELPPKPGYPDDTDVVSPPIYGYPAAKLEPVFIDG